MLPVLLSVIIPTCNRPETIKRAIDSVLIQGVARMEIIVSDDSGDDKTKLILDEYIAQGNIKYVTNASEHHGAGGNRNFGVSQAVGKYITFLDDDDVYLPGRLKNLLAIMELEKYIFVSSGRFYEVGDFSVISNYGRQLKGVIKLEHVSYSNNIDIGFMMKREVFMGLGGFDIGLANLEDWDFVLRMLMCGDGYKIGRLDYAVNLNPNRPRVSTSDYIGFGQLAEKHKNHFGKKWCVFMHAMSFQLSGSLSLMGAIKMSLSGGTIKPLHVYINGKLKSVKTFRRLHAAFSVDL